MNRLVVRLVLSHALVAALGGAATFVVVRLLAPVLFDQSLRMGMHLGRGPGPGDHALRGQVADVVTRALVVGTGVGFVAAVLFGAFAAYRLVKPLRALGETTRQIAQGRYAVELARPQERELADLADDIATLAITLEETETRRVRLVADVAHELRTPLTVAEGYVEGMIDGVVATSTAELARVGEELRRLRRLADDLSALSRTQEGRLFVRTQRVDLRETVAGSAERLRVQVEDAGLELRVDTGEAALWADADPDRIAQVITNLVGNAVRATPAPGVVSVRAEPAGEWALITVSDTGKGVAAEDLERIFERFYRIRDVDAPISDRGSGVGLTIARGIVRAHGGDLKAQSPGRGHGATFTARLPLAGGAQGAESR